MDTKAAPEAGPDAVPTPAVTDIKADDRLAGLAPRRSTGHRLRALTPVALASAGVHLLFFATVFLLSRAPAPAAAPQETAVEVVEEPSPQTKAEEPKPADRPAEAAKEPPASPPKAEAEEPKRDDKPEPKQQAEQQSQEPPKQQAKLDPSPAPKPSAEEAARVQALQDELAALKAQQADLQAQQADLQAQQAELEAQAQADAKAQAQNQASDRTKALGLLPESFAAVTVPSPSPTGEDPVSYQQVVYSLVAKAKRSGLAYMEGVAHLVFDIDEKGALTRVVVDHSSGNPAVDSEALALIRRAAPFPPPPAGAPRSFPTYLSFVPDP